MDIESIPLFAMLKGRMGYLNQRQQVIAQNVANASTPGFMPQDLKPFTAKGGGGMALAPVSQPQAVQVPGMIALPDQAAASAASSNGYKPVDAPDDDPQLDGNQVVLEQQMMKMNETRSQYDIAVGLYQKAMGFLQLAAQEPGKGS